MVERTEDLAVRQVLPISVSGELVELRVLTAEESDVWLREFTKAVDEPVDDIAGDSESLARIIALPAASGFRLIKAYDVDDALPAIEALRKRMSKMEVKAALDAMAEAEDPFGEGAVRLVDEVFGAPSRFLATLTRVTVDATESALERSQNGASDDGASTGATSDDAGRRSSFSSSGSTGTSTSKKRPRRSATPSATA